MRGEGTERYDLAMAHNYPHGDYWKVVVEWTGRNAGAPLSPERLTERHVRVLRRNDQRSVLDWFTAPGSTLSSAATTIIFGLVAFAIWPFVGPVLTGGAVLVLAVVEVALAVVIGAVAVVARTMMRRPWRIVAINKRREGFCWSQVGWREAQRSADEIQRQLNAGATPDNVLTSQSIPEGWLQLHDGIDDGLASRAWFQIASKGIAVMVVVWLILYVLGVVR